MSHHDRLTPEERALAALLRDAATPGPPAALDAAVLAAARAAVTTTGAAPAPPPAQDAWSPRHSDHRAPQRRVRRRPRWHAAAGIAASVVFAVGLAWQLQPASHEIPEPGTAVSSPSPTAATPSSAQQPAAPATDREPTAVPAPRTPPVKPAPVHAPRPAQRRVTARDEARAPAPAEEPAAAAAAMERITEPALAEAAADAPQDSAEAGMLHTVDKAVVKRRQAAPSIMAAPSPSPASDLSAQVQADARLPRRQWLLKIRQRNEAGEVDAARASLEAYLQAYPATQVPADLRVLLDH